jgi:CO/xanthine dehydrogenase FAD-binding subunit
VKPPPFEYDDPQSVEETLALLAEHGGKAKVLAGGQSLVPLLNFRLARPERLVDVNGVAELDYLRFENGVLRIGALTRHATLEHSAEAARQVPLLVQAVRFVGHLQIRNRGTVGGSVAHADAAAELPAALAALDARYRLRTAAGERVVASDEMFVSYRTTALTPDELLVAIEVDAPPPRTGSAFVEFSRRHGDVALGGAAVLVTLDEDGLCRRARVQLLAAAPTPLRARDAEEWLAGARIDGATAAEAAARAVAGITPPSDVHGSSGYRQELIATMVRRALLEAAARV